MKGITSKCEYVAPAIEVIKVVDMNTLLAGSPDVRPGTDPTVEPPLKMIGKRLKANHTAETSCAMCPAFKQVLTTEKTNTIL